MKLLKVKYHIDTTPKNSYGVDGYEEQHDRLYRYKPAEGWLYNLDHGGIAMLINNDGEFIFKKRCNIRVVMKEHKENVEDENQDRLRDPVFAEVKDLII